MTAHDILVAARALYASAPSHVPHPKHPVEGTYCMVTALDSPGYDAAMRAPWHGGARATIQASMVNASRALSRAIGTQNLVDWNAAHTTDEVLAAFDRAIEATA